MIIRRRGAEKDHGESSVKIDDPHIVWDPAGNCIEFRESKVADFTGPSKHDYRISVTLEELREMLDVVSEHPATDSPSLVAGALAHSLRSLVRIASVCVGATFARPKE
jgi:hypothetical protein